MRGKDAEAWWLGHPPDPHTPAVKLNKIVKLPVTKNGI
jgi:hypothetical protein